MSREMEAEVESEFFLPESSDVRSKRSWCRLQRKVSRGALISAISFAVITSSMVALKQLGWPTSMTETGFKPETFLVASEDHPPTKNHVKEDHSAKGNKPHKSKLPPCLCLFDVDRTLTSKQKWAGKCNGTQVMDGVQDSAYNGGTLVLSDLALNLENTFCHRCYRGIVTAGGASGDGSPERQVLLEKLGGTAKTRTDWWQNIGFKHRVKAGSSLTVQVSDTFKQDEAASILDWWHRDQKINLDRENVYFFDDRADNVQAFQGTGMNAQQISCQSRGPSEWHGMPDNQVGGCGGLAKEVAHPRKGVHVCDSA